MIREEIIKIRACEFLKPLNRYSNHKIGPDEFKNSLELKIRDYSDNTDKLIFLYEIHRKITSEIDRHIESCTYKGKGKCFYETQMYTMMYFLEQEIRELNPKFGYKILRPNIDLKLIDQNLTTLASYPEVGELYLSALDKLNEGKFERNLLDDLRLSLEILLKNILNNNYSLEKQMQALGSFLKEKGIKTELRNMITSMINYYGKYQNEYVKHNDTVNEKEIDVIVNLSSAFMNFIIQLSPAKMHL
ncbi:MAG: hypothetical protein CVU00_11655 [Bacteroidetes bacterium HGW-Bacteroidetes-17]|nr:MAG: hypothetical protein CVU00_11655 [Bacteroidetes bacterium HGW-Bacteroidetes-17]